MGSEKYISFSIKGQNDETVFLPEACFLSVLPRVPIWKLLAGRGLAKAVITYKGQNLPLMTLGEGWESLGLQAKTDQFVETVLLIQWGDFFFAMKIDELGAMMTSDDERFCLEKVLPVENIFNELRIQHSLPLLQKKQDQAVHKTSHFLIEVAHREFYVDFSDVVEILQSYEVQKSLFKNEFCDGYIVYRGKITPLYSTDFFVNKLNRSSLPTKYAMIVKNSDGDYLAFTFHGLKELVQQGDYEPNELASKSLGLREFICSEIARENLNSHLRVYKSEGPSADSQDNWTGSRRTYIQFKAEQHFALDIQYFEKILSGSDYEPLLDEDGLLLHYDSQSFPVIDARTLQPVSVSLREERKVLIVLVDMAGSKLIFAVDEVESILNAFDGQLWPFPQLLRAQFKGRLANFSRYCIENKERNCSVLVLDGVFLEQIKSPNVLSVGA